MTPFATYMTGFALLLAGISLAAWLVGVPLFWIAVSIVIVLAIGFLVATSRTHDADRAEVEPPVPEPPPRDAA